MRYWFGTKKDGSKELESETDLGQWNEVKNDLISLSLNNNGHQIHLPKNMKYVQGKSASASLTGGQSVIESRTIGFFLGSNIVRLRLNEITGDIKVEIEENVTSTTKS